MTRRAPAALVALLVAACSAGAPSVGGPAPSASPVILPSTGGALVSTQPATTPASGGPSATPLPPGPDVQFAGLLSAHDGWALTSTGLYLTADGGTSWRTATVPGPRTGRGVLGVAFADPLHGWLATLDSNDYRATVFDVWRTVDGGRTWQKAVLPEGANRSDTMGPVDFSLPDREHLFLLVEGGMPDGYLSDLYATIDGGTRWSADRMIAVRGATGPIAFADAEHGVIAGGAPGLLVTADAGRSWQGIDLPTPAGATATFSEPWSAPTFWNTTSGALVVTYANDVGPTGFGVLVTHDAGASWSLAATVKATATNDVPVAFTGPSEWLAMTDAMTLLHTTDGGRTWTRDRASGLPAAPQLLLFADPQHLWGLVGMGVCLTFKSNCSYRTGLYATSDGGRTWQALWPGRPS